MKLLDKPLTSFEKREKLDMLRGAICRISVSDDIQEIVSAMGFAYDYISLIGYSRVKELLNAAISEE